MAFRGLFIGIDRHRSPMIDELTCARRDATALDALFADALGIGGTLLVDDRATTANVMAELDSLAGCEPDDTVIITFSGHGSETHELVTFDTDPADLSGSSMSLDALQERLSRIRSKRLLLLLDCCFSGGIGAKVLHVEARPRGLSSAEARLLQLAGEGRIVFTASGHNEPAYEHVRYGHGFFTHYVLEALRGAEGVAAAGRISLYRLLDYVTERVKAAAHEIGRPQSPTFRGVVDGDISWPVFEPGARYGAAFPERAPARVTADLGSLVAVGFPPTLIEAWGKAVPSLNDLQIAAINDFGLLEGQHLVVSAPTSSGKTMVGELAALGHVLAGRRALFLLPLKALVADKRRHFQEVYGAFGIRVVEATGETDDVTPLLRGRYDVGLLTYEKFAAIALGHPHLLAKVGAIVVDEAQMIADAGRGANLEFLLTLIRMRRREGIEPQVVALSAVIGDTNGLELWLGANLLRHVERPVPLDEGVLRGDGSFRYLDAATGLEAATPGLIRREIRKGSSQDWIVPLVRRLVAEGQQVIVFRETKGEARGCAKYLAPALGLPAAGQAIDRLPAGDPSRASLDLREVLGAGVAFHNADLVPEERRAVEEEFRRPGSNLRVIASTTTLAMGVNTPASSVVIAGLEHPGQQPYSVAEYKNLVGRAGRLGYAEKGTSYLLAPDGRAEHDLWVRYVTGKPENLTSRLLDEQTDARSLVVRVLASAGRAAGEGVVGDDVIAFLEASFGAFQAGRKRQGWQWSRDDLRTALADLEYHGLIRTDAHGVHHLTSLGRLAGESGTEVRSIIRLTDALGELDPGSITDPTLLVAAQMTAELDTVLFPLNRRSTQKEPQVWAGELRVQGVPPSLLGRLHHHAEDDHSATLRAKKAVACLLYISGRAIDEVEATLTRFGGAFGGAAGPIRGVAARTSDLLPAVARVAEIQHPSLSLGDRIGRLTIRLTHGVASAAVDLARETGVELVRGDYRRLVEAGLCEPDSIDSADDEALLLNLDGNRRKVALVRDVAGRIRERRTQAEKAASPILGAYVA